MTRLPSPTDLSDLYNLMGPDALLAHIQCAVSKLEAHGVDLTPDAKRGIDEIEECVIDHHGRTGNQLALRQYERRFERELAAAL